MAQWSKEFSEYYLYSQRYAQGKEKIPPAIKFKDSSDVMVKSTVKIQSTK